MILEIDYKARTKLVEGYVNPFLSNEKTIQKFNICGENFGVKCSNTSLNNQKNVMCQSHIDQFVI